MSIRKRIKSFQFAIQGIRLSFLGVNFKIQLVCMLCAIGMGFLFSISSGEWLAIILVSGLVLMAETFNSSLETLVDLVSPNYNEKAGQVKDLAAGAVLILSIAALVVGFIIFIPKIWNYVAI